MTNLFHNISDISSSPSISTLEENIKLFLDYALLEIGGFININRPSSGAQTQGLHILNYVNDPAMLGRVWESNKKDWVYETEVAYNGVSPNSPSGIYINDTFVPVTDTGPYSYKINYPLGRVVFNSPMSTSLKVEASYSYRYIQTYIPDNAPWFKEIQKQSFDKSQFQFFGDSFITANHRVQLPCIIIELAPRTILAPYELGNVKNYITQDVLFHILTENTNKSKNIADLLLMQKDNTFNLLNLRKIAIDNLSDVDYIGQKNPNRQAYRLLSENINYITNKCIIKNSTINGFSSLTSNLYSTLARWTIEIFP